MNLRYLNYFQILAKYQHYTRTAEELNIAQSSLSHGIHCLEEELGTVLFEKQGRNVILTRQGAQYLRYVDAALNLLEDGQHQLQKSSAGVIEIGFVSSVRRFLIEKINAFQKCSPYTDCQFSLYEGTTESLIQDLRRDKLDLILASAPGDTRGVSTKALHRQQLVVIDSESRPHIRDKKINIPNLSSLPLVMHTTNSGMRKITDTLFETHGQRPLIMGEASGDSAIITIVELGTGVAIVTDSEDIHRPGIRVIELDDAENYRYIYLTRKKARYVPPVLQAFISFMET